MKEFARFDPSTTYEAGDDVAHGGGLWEAVETTVDEPPGSGSAWRTWTSRGDVTVPPVIPSADVRFKSILITAEQLASFGTVPVELVAAPGAGFVIVPVSLIVRYVFGTVPFSTQTNIGVTWDGGTDYVMDTPVGTNESESTLSVGALAGGSNLLSDVENKALTTLTSDQSDLADGDGSLVVGIGYTLLSV